MTKKARTIDDALADAHAAGVDIEVSLVKKAIPGMTDWSVRYQYGDFVDVRQYSHATAVVSAIYFCIRTNQQLIEASERDQT